MEITSQRESRVRENKAKSGEAFNLKDDSPQLYISSSKGVETFLHTGWGTSVQMPQTMGDISHSKSYRWGSKQYMAHDGFLMAIYYVEKVD